MKRLYDVVATGVQSFEQRFPGKRRRLDEDIPQPALWRCNLTGLSQEQNLYLVAYGADIYVYVPSFPAQSVGEPVLVLPCRASGLGIAHMDPRQPSHINNLLVAHLGADEVIAVVRDSGDVDVFLIRHVLTAVRRRALAPLGIIADEIRPFFQGNVGISAWGLAVHTKARIIAVSSNAHEVTIFKFGLIDGEERLSDVSEQVVNGDCNIPCIAFCNTGNDPGARWLLTTDINGVCRTIDLSRSLPTQSFRFSRQLGSVYGAGFDRVNAGWSIMFLDPRSFTRRSSMNEAIGLGESEDLPDAKDSPRIWDLSKTVRRVTENSHAFIRHQAGGRASHKPLYVNQSVAQRPAQDDTATNIDVEIFEEISIVDDDVSEVSETILPDLVDDDDPDDEGTEDTTPASAYYGGERICGNTPRFSTAAPMCDRLPCPILHASVRNIYLLQPTTTMEGMPCQPPFVGMAAPLKQSIQIEFHTLNDYDRLNMSAYIPQLGVVIIASQKGRAAVLALNKLDHSTQYPRGMLDLGSRTVYSTCIVAVLPFDSQEKLNQRPFAPLHGIAAGPMQGSEYAHASQKRWRLMLMYADHSILTYEIARSLENSTVVI